MCNNATEGECRSLRMFGSGGGDLAGMQRSIKADTQLFLFNFQSLKLMGVFISNGPPEHDIVPTAWGGRFSAQVRVVPRQTPVVEMTLDRRMTCGAKSAIQVHQLRQTLQLPSVAEETATQRLQEQKKKKVADDDQRMREEEEKQERAMAETKRKQQESQRKVEEEKRKHEEEYRQKQELARIQLEQENRRKAEAAEAIRRKNAEAEEARKSQEARRRAEQEASARRQQEEHSRAEEKARRRAYEDAKRQEADAALRKEREQLRLLQEAALLSRQSAHQVMQAQVRMHHLCSS